MIEVRSQSPQRIPPQSEKHSEWPVLWQYWESIMLMVANECTWGKYSPHSRSIFPFAYWWQGDSGHFHAMKHQGSRLLFIPFCSCCTFFDSCFTDCSLNKKYVSEFVKIKKTQSFIKGRVYIQLIALCELIWFRVKWRTNGLSGSISCIG